MTCDAVRAAMLAGDEAEWPSGVLAHLAACDSCTDVAVERALRRAPAIAIPPAFAVDVARRARLDAPPEMPHLSAATVGIGAVSVLIGVAVAWFGLSEPSVAVVPAAALLLACGEAVVLAAWTLDTDVTRARWRR
jgi:hypothetical protein